MAKFVDIFENVTKEGCKIPQEDYLDEGLYPIIDQGQKQIAGFANDPNGLYYNVPAIIFGDHTRIIKYVDTPCFLGADGVKLLRAKNPNANYKFLYYALSNVKIPNTGYNRHFKWLKEADIQLPSEEQQRKVVAVLDYVSGLIFLRKQQLAKLDELVKARFVEMFGDLGTSSNLWEKKSLVDVCKESDDIKCGPFGTQLGKDEYQTDGVAIWEIPQINSHFKTRPTHFLSAQKAEALRAYSIMPDDIAMSRKGNVGRCAIFPKGFKPGIIHSDVLRIRVDDKIVLPKFLMYQLHYSAAVQEQINVVSSGAIMAGINVTKLKCILVHIPPMKLQQEFVRFDEKLGKAQLTIQQGLDKLEMLKRALMQEYFG